MTEEVLGEVPKDGEKPLSAEDGSGVESGNSVTPTEIPKAPETASERVEGKYQELLSRVTPATASSNTDDDEHSTVLDAKHIGALTDEASKVQKLLDLAQTKGVVHAVKVARSLRDYYVLDAMHDELSGKLYQGMLEKGLIKGE